MLNSGDGLKCCATGDRDCGSVLSSLDCDGRRESKRSQLPLEVTVVPFIVFSAWLLSRRAASRGCRYERHKSVASPTGSAVDIKVQLLLESLDADKKF